MKDNKGFTIVELMISLVIFSFVITGVYGVYITLSKHSVREYKKAESEMELEIAKNFIERDIAMAGYGIAIDYGTLGFNPVPVEATDGDINNPDDTLILRGTAIGRFSRAAQGWTRVTATSPAFDTQDWNDVREDVKTGDRVIYMEPNTKTLLTSGSAWKFEFLTDTPPATIQEGTLVYGLNTSNDSSAQFPFYVVEYTLGGNPPAGCAPGTQNLQRAESSVNDPDINNPIPDGERLPILACVLDLQVAFGLDNDGDRTIDIWDNGGAMAANPPFNNPAILRNQLIQVRIYMLVQSGNRNPDEDVYPAGTTFRVGDANLGIGRDMTFEEDDPGRRYRWRVISLNITPKNLR